MTGENRMRQLVDQDKGMEISYRLLSLTKQTWLGEIPPRNIFLPPNSTNRHKRVLWPVSSVFSLLLSLHAFPLPWSKLFMDHHYLRKYSPPLTWVLQGLQCGYLLHYGAPPPPPTMVVTVVMVVCCFFPYFLPPFSVFLSFLTLCFISFPRGALTWTRPLPSW